MTLVFGQWTKAERKWYILKQNYVYPVIIKEEDGAFNAEFPDFPEQMTCDDTEEGIIQSAQEVLALCIIQNEDEGVENPEPSGLEELADVEGKVVYVNVWVPYFRKLQKEVYVKKTLTIPQWIDILAKEKNVNFSAILVKGLKQELGFPN